MTSLITEPQLLAAAATDASAIGSALNEAKAAAAGPTTSLMVAAQDEVSAITASLFGAYGQQYQALAAQASAFHEQFVAALAAAGNAYAQAEAEIAGTLGLTGGPSTASQAVAALTRAADPVVNDILVMTGSGVATPSSAYLSAVASRFLTNFTGPLTALTTPEGLYPITGVKDLTLDVSLARGVTALDTAINQTISPGTGSIAVFGISQSSIIAAMEMPKLLAEGFTPGQVSFSLVGNESAPNGGMLTRFPGLSLPSLGITFGTATPSNDFPTTIWQLEYDGFADFPQYPIDIFSDLNAVLGIAFVHGTYPTLTAAQLGSAITLPQSGAPSMTTYELIPTQNLPLLDPLRAIPVIGNPLADLLQPDLTALVNWGYGNPAFGYSTGPANVVTPFGFLPPLSDTTALGSALISGTQQGIGAFLGDLSHLPATLSAHPLSGLTSLLTGAALPTPSIPSLPGIISGIESANTTFVNTLTTDISTAYSVLLPTADIGTALLVSMPSYDVNLFLNGIQQAVSGQPLQGLINAFGDPIAADVGLVTIAGGVEFFTVENAFQTVAMGTPHPGLS